MATVVLYSRPECHLCDDARSVLVAEAIQFEEIDIDDDDALLKRYLERIPVVSIDGHDAFEFFVDATRLRELIARSDAGLEADQR